MSYSVLISERQIAERLQELAGEIETTLHPGEDIIVLALLNGALWFAADLLRLLPDRFILQTLRTSSYGAAKQTSGTVTLQGDLAPFSGKIVLIVDDVADAGLTLAKVRQELLAHKAKHVYTAVAIDKQGQRQIDITPDFTAFSAGSEFLIGYGMDYDGKYRNLPFIAVLHE